MLCPGRCAAGRLRSRSREGVAPGKGIGYLKPCLRFSWTALSGYVVGTALFVDGGMMLYPAFREGG
jgi:hypothetical protein